MRLRACIRTSMFVLRVQVQEYTIVDEKKRERERVNVVRRCRTYNFAGHHGEGCADLDIWGMFSSQKFS